MTDLDLLAMSRYLAFTGVALTIVRILVEAVRSCRNGQPVRRVMIRRVAYLPLLGVLVYYVRALYVPGIPDPAPDDIVIVNLFYGLFFILTAWPLLDRASDRPSRPWR